MVVAVLLGLLFTQQAANAERLPDLPRLTVDNFLPAVRDQIQKAYAAAQANPNDADVNGRLAMVLDAYEQYDSAIVCYQRAHLLDPRSFRWLYLLGSAQEAQGLHEQAAASFGGAALMRPDDLAARSRLASTLIAIGQWHETRSVAELITHEHPESAEAHYDLGRALAGLGDTAGAVIAYEKAIELFPQFGAAHYALAMACRKLGREDEARQHFALYEQHKTTSPPLDDPLRREVMALNLGSIAHIRRAADLERAGQIEEAIAEMQEALRVEPRSVQAETNLVSLYGRLGRYDEAAAHYEAGLEIDRNQADLHYNYGVALMKQGRSGEAEAAFREAVRINPAYVEARNNLGTLFEQQGQLDAAMREFEAAVDRRPGDRTAHFHIGRILASQQKYAAAVQHFLKTLSPEDDNTPRYLYALGATYARMGDYPDALSSLRKARSEAAARGQDQLVASIDRDLQQLAAADTHKP
jgi:tetratricopeptide (TPR) repeat protein